MEFFCYENGIYKNTKKNPKTSKNPKIPKSPNPIIQKIPKSNNQI
jgi:hypothetical protein